jgi:two-component system chemotaxis sensor kinase CheA
VDELDAIRETFFQECEELLADLELGLAAMQEGAADGETVNAVFRAVHSVKGGAGAFGLEPLVRFAHVFETLLDALRSNKVELTPDMAETLLRAADVLADHVQAARGSAQVEEERSAEMARALEAYTDPGAALRGPAAPAAADDLGIAFKPLKMAAFDFADAAPPAPAAAPGWIVRLKPRRELYAKANDVLLLMRELERLGPITPEIDAAALPTLDGLDAEQAYFSWTVRLDADVSEAQVREVFEFVEDDCELVIEPASAAVAAPAPFDLASLLQVSDAPSEPAAPFDIAALIAATRDPSEPAPEAAPVRAPAAKSDAPAAQATIRCDPARIDRLIDLVGELVINQAMLAQRVTECGLGQTSQVAMGLEDLEQLTREIQDSVMAIRAQPVRSVFQRMPRLVREVAAMVNKQVRLVTDGEGTEVDKTVIERISEPITHMLRNAIDHGLETTEERAAAGKSSEGEIRLRALHRSGRIVIEVEDDGRGINREKVFSIAVKKGLIAADAQLSDEEIDNLIFLPGFSTATSVSDISGRGVGMDVVRRSVQGLGGRINITSRPGHGSTFTMSLPLTLAVLDGMVVDVAGQTLVAPISAIVESLQPEAHQIHKLGPRGAVLLIRDEYVPLIDIGEVFGYRAEPTPPLKCVMLLVEGEDGSRAALCVDSIQGQRQVVIKSLEANYRQVEGIAAATILGDGRVALIIDVDTVVAMRRREPQRMPDPSLYAAE